jgi:hypothetical protein
VYFELTNNQLVGRTASNSTRSTTTSAYVVSPSIWYRLVAVLNTAGSTVNFYVYNSSGTELWTDSLSANIPTGAERHTGHVLAGIHTGASVLGVCSFDYVDVRFGNKLTVR